MKVKNTVSQRFSDRSQKDVLNCCIMPAVSYSSVMFEGGIRHVCDCVIRAIAVRQTIIGLLLKLGTAYANLLEALNVYFHINLAHLSMVQPCMCQRRSKYGKCLWTE